LRSVQESVSEDPKIFLRPFFTLLFLDPRLSFSFHYFFEAPRFSSLHLSAGPLFLLLLTDHFPSIDRVQDSAKSLGAVYDSSVCYFAYDIQREKGSLS
jgi:hypothetical protein